MHCLDTINKAQIMNFSLIQMYFECTVNLPLVQCQKCSIQRNRSTHVVNIKQLRSTDGELQSHKKLKFCQCKLMSKLPRIVRLNIKESISARWGHR